MKLMEKKLTIRKEGYVKTDAELEQLCEEAERIMEHYLIMMREELTNVGYNLEVK